MKLKTNLLVNILNNSNIHNKYSNAFINIKAVIELELKTGYELEKDVLDQFKLIKKEYNNFLNNIPLKVIERYYYLNMDNLNKYLYIEYNNNEINIKVIDLYLKLEEFFEKCYMIASKIADLYALEVKINEKNKYDEQF